MCETERKKEQMRKRDGLSEWEKEKEREESEKLKEED